MLAYFGYTISPNMLETQDGFLICRNVPIARTGEMEYAKSELGLQGNDIVTVKRSPEVVFSESALSSFEGKPVTDDHPPDLVTPETYCKYARGHAQNIRRGTGDLDGYVIADLHIQDINLIQEIQSGKREISCGYECDYVENEDGTYSQLSICGNHIAVVVNGRAGEKVAIKDSKKKAASKPERNKMGKKKSNDNITNKNTLLLKLFGRVAKDEEMAGLDELAEEVSDAMVEIEPPATGESQTQDNTAIDVNKIVDSVFEKLMAALKPAEADPLDQAIKDLEGSVGEEAKIVPAEEMDAELPSTEPTGIAADKAVIAKILKNAKPAIAGISNDAERKKVTDALLSCLQTKDAQNEIAKIVGVTQKIAHDDSDSNPKAMDLNEIQSAYDRLNPHKAQQGGNAQ